MRGMSPGLKPISIHAGNVRAKVRTYLRGKYAMRWLAIAVCGGLLIVTPRVHAATYYVTVAGLGGEPDYEQRFTANAMDLDKIFKSVAGAHVYHPDGQAIDEGAFDRGIAQVAQEAKPEDDLVVTLIGHGSFDGVEYKFNLVGPDISAARPGCAMRQGPGEAAVNCGHDQRQRRRGGGAGAARQGGDCRDQIGY